MTKNDDTRDRLGLTPPLWLLILVTSLFVVVCGALWGYVLVTRQTVLPAATPSVVFILQTPESPITPVPTPTPLVFETPILEPTATLPLGPSVGEINIGALVSVTGTENAGLNLRSEPGTSGARVYQALESEVFYVTDGPVEMDGFRWWKLTAQADETRVGWGVENFLGVLRGP